ncbi:MAG: NAD(P)/FAD-dependent oxidoreductase [Anaerolineales bacterium]|jgi:phytoene dehydrogenase-like protein
MLEKDCLIVGSGPNGLAAAIMLARAGFKVTVHEGAATPGGGTRTAELTLPGFQHDVCAAVIPLAVASPFFSSINLKRHGLRWVQPQIPLAHPLDEGPAVFLHRDLALTASELGEDRKAYLRTFAHLVNDCPKLLPELLAPLHVPRHPLQLARFGISAVQPAEWLAKARFTGNRTRALFAGLAAHSMLPLSRALSSAFSLVLGMLAHSVGWPFVSGGTQRLTEALIVELRNSGGEILTGEWVTASRLNLQAGLTLLDLSPRGLLELTGEKLPEGYRSSLETYRYGPGIYKIDWALEGPVPWADRRCLQAGTLHLGGTMAEISTSEAQVWNGEHPASPFVIFVQPSLFDQRRAPPGKHTAWAYCHVPQGSDRSMATRIESQVERFAPGFKERILARHTMNAAQMEAYNPNYVGGDINVGVQDLSGHFLRPARRLDPYRTPLEGLFLCSSATPPGGGVHGMCGYHAARSALRWMGARR